MMGASPRRQFPLVIKAQPVRALVEALLLGFGLLALSLGFASKLSPLYMHVTWIGPLCVLFYVLRVRLSEQFLRRQSFIDTALAVALALALNVMAFIFAAISQTLDLYTNQQATTQALSLFLIVGMVLDIVMFVVFRAILRLWLFWNRLRRTQLVWSLTHAHVVLGALGAVLGILLVDIILLRSQYAFPAIIPTTLGLATVSVFGLIVAIPPIVLFSYLVMSRTTRRLKTLTSATSILRSGNYAVRVPVEGEDEVAQLQSDFNVMAEGLERAMRDLQRERDTVAALLESRRELIANVSHELRTPMATLRGYLETTLMHWNEGPPPTLHHDMLVMEDEVIRLQALVEDLFTLARSEVGRLSLQCRPTDVRKLVQRVVDVSAPLVWRTSKITMVAEVPSWLPQVSIDPSRLEQALQNLLRNGVRHTSPGGIVAVVVTIDNDMVKLQVKDTGEGIAAADLPHIWQRFYQTASTRARQAGGAGLGLALVKEWIEAMGGTVGVESVLGEGSGFIIRLPALPNSPSEDTTARIPVIVWNAPQSEFPSLS